MVFLPIPALAAFLMISASELAINIFKQVEPVQTPSFPLMAIPVVRMKGTHDVYATHCETVTLIIMLLDIVLYFYTQRQYRAIEAIRGQNKKLLEDIESLQAKGDETTPDENLDSFKDKLFAFQKERVDFYKEMSEFYKERTEFYKNKSQKQSKDESHGNPHEVLTPMPSLPPSPPPTPPRTPPRLPPLRGIKIPVQSHQDELMRVVHARRNAMDKTSEIKIDVGKKLI